MVRVPKQNDSIFLFEHTTIDQVLKRRNGSDLVVIPGRITDHNYRLGSGWNFVLTYGTIADGPDSIDYMTVFRGKRNKNDSHPSDVLAKISSRAGHVSMISYVRDSESGLYLSPVGVRHNGQEYFFR